MALEDLGIVRCIPNLIVANPADFNSTINIVKTISKIKGPAYIRLGRDPSPMVFNEDYLYKIGKANIIINNGKDLGIITSGIILNEVIQAVKQLNENGIKVKLIEVPTIKPIDIEAIIDLAQNTEKIITIEEHNIIGGLFSAVSEVICRLYPKKVYPLAIPDKFTESGLPSELLKKYKLNSDNIVKEIISVIN